MDWTTKKTLRVLKNPSLIHKTSLQTHVILKQKLFFSNRIISLHYVEGFFEAELSFSKLYVMVIMIKKALSFNFCVDKALQGSANLKGSNT